MAYRSISMLQMFVAGAIITGCCLNTAVGQSQLTVTKSSKPGSQQASRTVARLFWQDDAKGSIRWGDLKLSDALQLQSQEINGFPALDQERQNLVQMQSHAGMLLTGVHDSLEGKFQSGWVAIDSGLGKQEHGDHFHWTYSGAPKIIHSQLDDRQGNPAHVYVYAGKFYLANDKHNGFTVVSPAELTSGHSAAAASFHTGGGGHITLAAFDNSVCYSTWIDREGENAGRVDVVNMTRGVGALDKYSIRLPSGGIHGAVACANRAFFAPADGICWVNADRNFSLASQNPVVHHLSLGKDANGKPLRTGAFESFQSHVLFHTGSGPNAALCAIDARAQQPTISRLNIPLAEGSSLSTPVAVRTRFGKSLAMVFEESRSADATEKLNIIDLDPNGDAKFDDLRIEKSLEVGRSQIEGHSGHHGLSIAGSRICITNPGDGSIWIFSLSDFNVQVKLSVGGKPTRLIALGG